MFDLIVLGGGPAGYLAAERAGHAGLSVLLIEKKALGGVCLNEGCIPSKTLLNSSKLYEHAKNSAVYGVNAQSVTYDHAAVVARKDKVVRKLVAGVKSQMKANHVTVVSGEGVISGRQDGAFVLRVGEEQYLGKKLIIATGSQTIVPPIEGAKEQLETGFLLTNREILDLKELPESLAVVGGGVIGLEMAAYFAAVGSKVTVIEMLDQIGGSIDREIATILQSNLERQGVHFALGCKVTAFENGTVRYTDKAGASQSVHAQKALLSVGRRPVTQGFGLESLGVFVERGRIVVDERMQTNVAGVYASGDVNGKLMLAHTAYRQSEVIVNNLTGKPDIMRYDAIPSAIYTQPEVGAVGETTQSLEKKGVKYVASTVSMNYSGRYMAENEQGDGICKLLFDESKTRLLGCHIIGGCASEIIVSAAMMIESQLRVSDMKEFIFPHPSICEIIREAIFALQ